MSTQAEDDHKLKLLLSRNPPSNDDNDAAKSEDGEESDNGSIPMFSGIESDQNNSDSEKFNNEDGGSEFEYASTQGELSEGNNKASIDNDSSHEDDLLDDGGDFRASPSPPPGVDNNVCC
jgi:hypothetical protein